MKLSNQAMGALMMALQKSLMDQSDVTKMLQEFDFSLDASERLVVNNPPVLRFAEDKNNDESEKEIIMPREDDFFGNA